MKKLLLFILLPLNLWAFDNNYRFEYESFKKAALESNTLTKKQKKLLNTVSIQTAKNYQELPPMFGAMCNTQDNIVYVHPNLINTSYLNKQQAIDHELGHCILNRSHKNTSMMKLGLEYPQSTMHFMLLAYESEIDMFNKRKELFLKQYYGSLSIVEKEVTKLGGSMNPAIWRQQEHKIITQIESKR